MPLRACASPLAEAGFALSSGDREASSLPELLAIIRPGFARRRRVLDVFVFDEESLR